MAATTTTATTTTAATATANGTSLGTNQLHVLKSVYERRGWHAGCGWLWNTVSGTLRILEALAKRGLVTKVQRDPSNNRSASYKINDAGIAVLCEHNAMIKYKHEAALEAAKTAAATADMVLYRPHRGTLEDAIQVAKEVPTKAALVEKLKHDMRHTALAELISDETIVVMPYGYDERIDWDTQIVSLKGHGVLGYTSKPFKD